MGLTLRKDYLINSKLDIKVLEGSSGILYIKSGLDEYVITPDCKLEPALQHLLKFKKTYINEDDYNIEGFNWYQTAVSYLYWMHFWQYTRYEKIINQNFQENNRIFFLNNSNLSNLYKNYQNIDDKLKYKNLRILINSIIEFRNIFIGFFSSTDIIFLKNYTDDFRSKEIIGNLSNKYKIKILAKVKFREFILNFFNADLLFAPYIVSENVKGSKKLENTNRLYYSAEILCNKIVSENIYLFKKIKILD